MLPRILLALTLAAPMAALAQYATIGPAGQITSAGSTVIVVGSNTGPVLSTPSMTFGTPAGTAGISLAERTGISNVAPAATAVPGAFESFPVYNPNLPVISPQPVSGESATAAAAASSTGRLIHDVGPSYFAGAGFVGGSPEIPAGAAARITGATSLGEVAEKYKLSRPQNIRTYTNADAQRLRDTLSLRGANLSPVLAQSAPAVTPQLSASARPSPAIREETAQTGASAQPAATTPATEQGATLPQAGQRSSAGQNDDQQAATRLPASSTLLPLFGLLGIASGALGLWLRNYRS